jgi:hypothetical protein
MTIDPFEFAAFVIYLAVVGSLLVVIILMSIKLIRLNKINGQLKVDLNIYFEQLVKALDSQDSQAIEETQGFIKFVSESRDKAFEYIANVQEAIENYRRIADVVPLSHDMTVEQAKKLSEAYDKLMDFLPKEDLI